MADEAGSSIAANTFRIYVKENTSFSLSVRGDQVILATHNEADISQYWVKYDKQVKDDIPTFVLVNRFTGQALKQPSKTRQRMQLDIYVPDADDDQLLWTERTLKDNYKNIVSLDNKDLVLDAYAGSEVRGPNGTIVDGNPIVLWENNDTRNQRWKLAHVNITYGGVFFGQSF